MLCPDDQTPLVLSERQGVEIDYCPRCRGVWLDRGELDKILEKALGKVAEGVDLVPPTQVLAAQGDDGTWHETSGAQPAVVAVGAGPVARGVGAVAGTAGGAGAAAPAGGTFLAAPARRRSWLEELFDF